MPGEGDFLLSPGIFDSAVRENTGLLFNPDDFRLTRFQTQCELLFC